MFLLICGGLSLLLLPLTLETMIETQELGHAMSEACQAFLTMATSESSHSQPHQHISAIESWLPYKPL